MTPAGLVKGTAVFVPEVKALEPDIAAALATIAKARAILAPMLARVEAGQPAFLEALTEAPQLEELLPGFAAALKTYDKLLALAEAYEARLVQAAQS